MGIGALIVAAGMSSRMGQFKPMLNIGSISIAQRIVTTLQCAGADKIVVVTGYNAVELEKHLAGNGIIFLRNEEYETTQMFDSVKIGLRYLQNKCEKVLFTPVDIPLFTIDTVRTILESEEALVCPICQGKTGHPLLIDASLIEEILNDSGEQGLHGATKRCSEELKYIEVMDYGTIRDADTPEDFEELLAYHNSKLVRPEVKVSLAKEKIFLDHKMAMLLMLIDETESVRLAGLRMQLSYSTCWNMIRTLESQLKSPLLKRSQGGVSGSTSVLTERGRILLNKYQAYEKCVKNYAKDKFEEYFQDFLGEEDYE